MVLPSRWKKNLIAASPCHTTCFIAKLQHPIEFPPDPICQSCPMTLPGWFRGLPAWEVQSGGLRWDSGLPHLGSAPCLLSMEIGLMLGLCPIPPLIPHLWLTGNLNILLYTKFFFISTSTVLSKNHLIIPILFNFKFVLMIWLFGIVLTSNTFKKCL